MWLFTKNGHLTIGQYSFNPELLVVQAQLRAEMDSFVTLLNELGGQKHEVQEMTDGDYRFLVMAKRAVVAEAVTKMVVAVDYGKFLQSVHFDFGKQPGFLVWMNQTGLQVATVRE